MRGELFTPLERSWLLCDACGHRCRIPPGRYGICKVRENRDGVLFVPSGYTAGVALDPIEKKPFFHALPGSTALSFGMLGCDYHCAYCQNWITSQALRDPAAGSRIEPAAADRLVRPRARSRRPGRDEHVQRAAHHDRMGRRGLPRGPRRGTEDVVRVERQRDAGGAGVSPSAPRPVQGRSEEFPDRHYRRLGGTLETVLDTIRSLHAMGVWIEVVTLLVPGLNDSDDESSRDCGVRGVRIRGHPVARDGISRGLQDDGPGPTTARALVRAAGIGRAAGLHFVYAGNLPGMTDGNEDTRCPSCRNGADPPAGIPRRREPDRAGVLPAVPHADIPGVWE